ncbi:MAG: energy transducer TonB [Alphaproteobacteria bacterium]|nr:energy transducer TonB [Alphaproteobacteria bacterium]
MRWVFGIVVGLSSASSAFAADTSPPRVGPVVVGMTVEAAQAALPSAAWGTVVSPHTGKVIGTKAEAAWTLDEQPYEIGLRSLRYGAAVLTLRSQTQVRGVRVCRTRVLALAAYFEQFFGELRPAAGASPFKTRKTGRNAQVGEAETESEDDLFGEDSAYGWFFAQDASAAYPFGVSATAQYLPERGSCAITADVVMPAKNRPDFEVLDTKTVKPTVLPSPSMLSFSLEGLDLPKGGKTVTLNCAVVRAAGYMEDCFEGVRGSAPTPEGRAAKVRAGKMAFDPKQLDPDNDVPLRAMLAIKLLPSERRTPAELGVSHPAPPVNNPPPPPMWTPPSVKHVWAKVPTPDELTMRYPAAALRDDIEGAITATCTVRADLSLACTDITGDPPGVFEAAGKSVLALYRVAPTLKDGTLAAGATFKLRVKFVIPD